MLGVVFLHFYFILDPYKIIIHIAPNVGCNYSCGLTCLFLLRSEVLLAKFAHIKFSI